MRNRVARGRMTAVVVVVLFCCGSGLAQDTEEVKKKSAKQSSLSDLDVIAAEYRELVCSRAADPENSARLNAIEIALEQGYVDARFDAVIRDALKESLKPERWDPSEILLAHKMLPLSTLSPAEKTGLIFQCYLKSEESKADYKVLRELRGELKKFPDETSRLVLEHVEAGGDFRSVLSLVNIVGIESDKILPRLLEVARSEDQELANYAMTVIPGLIKELKQRVISGVDDATIKKLGVKNPDPKFVEYARRIVTRYDRNRDQKLSPKEYQTMLMSPAKSDLDGDGLITISEYAIWMQSRAKK